MEPLSDGLSAFYGGFHRAAWAIALGWLIFACCGGFIPLSRISYIIYLMHFTVIWTFESVMIYPLDGTNLMMTIFFLAVLFYTTVVSAVIYVCLEMPWLASEKLLFAAILGKASSAG